ncbi:MAG: energy-coupling factor transporter transmembrane protein EcfT [Eggerthellaceae bacterium]|jgi:energy-coupling factor transport system permease protein|nr:energy-coupling factor transporter transmembrane protein EcfT [Eggerthellaceae bacterium]MDR2721766.1 energy-coupling factor transporter transmembrane protein EcfT [Coriobacteriaceae bacterium]
MIALGEQTRETQTSKLHAFDSLHPTIQLGCFAAILILTMVTIHPIFLALSFVAAFSFCGFARGWKTALATLAWQAPLVLLCAAINPLFSSAGTTTLFHLGSKAVMAESVVFGGCMGLMLAAVILWFCAASAVLTSDKVMAVLGSRLPSIGLMVSMTMRLVPQFVERGRLIEGNLRAVSAAAPQNSQEVVGGRIRLVSTLMGWSMEDSLERADAMKARGWGATKTRTTYKRYQFRRFDAVALALCGVLGALSAVSAWLVCSRWQFYPALGSLAPWWAYLPFALFMFLPLLACISENVRGGNGRNLL